MLDLISARNRLNVLQRHKSDPETIEAARADLAAAHIAAVISEHEARLTPDRRRDLVALLTGAEQ